MPAGLTPRHALPELFVGQTQKEITHNEALGRIDALLHPEVQGVLATPPAGLSMDDDGKCWIVDATASGVWLGKEMQIARWSAGSWRYLLPVKGMSVWHVADSKRLFYIGSDWIEPAAIPAPAGGTVIDVEARAAVVAILDHLRQISHVPS
jgi:Protein of unknown function (DUF2793)